MTGPLNRRPIVRGRYTRQFPSPPHRIIPASENRMPDPAWERGREEDRRHSRRGDEGRGERGQEMREEK
eukprot:228996-Hanusia_phi.AAC.4